MTNLRLIRKIRLTQDQEARMSEIVNSLRIGDQVAAKENWGYLIQSLCKTTGVVSENDINNLIQQAISKSNMALGIIDSPNPDNLEKEIRLFEERLNTVGDDAQLANVDLQNVLQKQQQTLQMVSNISKMLHDTAMAVIRKISG